LTVGPKGDRIAWACEEVLALYGLKKGIWITHWKGDGRIEPRKLAYTPDGAHLWCLGGDRVIVVEMRKGGVTYLKETNAPAAACARSIYFDSRRKLVLLATSRGVVCADYEGRIVSTLNRAGEDAK
jgi:hypothetical protein